MEFCYLQHPLISYGPGEGEELSLGASDEELCNLVEHTIVEY